MMLFSGDEVAEVVNAMTGKTEDHQVSRLAKKFFFHRYMQLVQTLEATGADWGVKLADVPSSYYENKEKSSQYQVR